MIELKKLTFTYPGAENPALKNVDLEIPEGEFTLVAGVSGSGKSTLLRCLNGLVPHFSGGRLSGIIRVNGLDPVTCSPKVMNRHVGFVFQDPETQFVLNLVQDDIAFSLENAALEPEYIRAQLDQILEQLELESLRERRIETLSGGERQQVAIAAALVFGPKILVLDEPTSQLDPASAQEVLDTVLDLRDMMNLTVIMSEHRLERVLPYAQRVVYMNADAGEVISAPPSEAVKIMRFTPPVTRLGMALNWDPPPLSVQDARSFLDEHPDKKPAHILTGVVPAAESAEGEETPLLEPFLQVEDVSVALGGQSVLRDINLDLRLGEILVLMGPNGAGKTTLLRTMIGLQKPNTGRVLISNEESSAFSVADICRQVGFLPQDPNSLLFSERVVDELLVTLHNQDMVVDEGWIKTLLRQLSIDPFAEAYPRELSVGQRQRVALGAIMVTRPHALLLDEPTRGLDPLMKQDLGRILKDWKAQGKGILIVTHDVEFAAGLADRVAVLSKGEVVARGTAVEVLGGSALFAPQIARLFPGLGWLTLEDVLINLNLA